MFAKIFGTDDDQVLVVLDQNDEGEDGMRITVKPKNDLLGLCSTFLTFVSEEKRQQSFASMTEEIAQKASSSLRKAAESFGGNE